MGGRRALPKCPRLSARSGLRMPHRERRDAGEQGLGCSEAPEIDGVLPSVTGNGTEAQRG